MSLSGAIASGPFAGLGISASGSGTAVFSGTGAQCSPTNPLKKLELTGTSSFVIG